jgi:myo-inositol-hexaphosphate 3-phosphohydrolase
MTKLITILLAVVVASACKSGNPQLRQDITAAVASTKPGLDQCYNLALARNRRIGAGFFTVDAVIEGATGQFKDVVVRRDEVQSPEVRQCVVMTMRSLSVKPSGQTNTQASFAFRFTATQAQ